MSEHESLFGDAAQRRASHFVTHGRHCSCSACAREDWTKITGPCGMHGAGCPAVYAPIKAERDPFADDVLERLVRANQDYQRAHGHYIVPLAERLLKARRAERQRDVLWDAIEHVVSESAASEALKSYLRDVLDDARNQL